MTLIVIVVALVCERLLSHLRRWRNYNWFGRYLTWLQRSGIAENAWESAWGLLCLVPPLAAIGFVQWWLQGGVLGLLGLVFAVLVLVFALGPRDLWEEVHKLMNAREAARRGESEAIARDLTAVAGVQPSAAPGDREIVRAVVLQAHERVLGVLFWFFLLGPLGAAGYRLLADLPRHMATQHAGAGLMDATARLHAVAAWLPLRLSALLYGLAGSTDGALAGWRRAEAVDDNWASHGWRLLAETGCGALQIEEGADHHRVALGLNETLRQALGLAWRSLMILLAIFAAFTIGGWLA